MIWPFDRRRRYNGSVAALLPALAIDLDEAGPTKVLDTLDVAWSKGFTPYEAALLIAYSVAAGFAGGGYIYRAQSIIREKIRPIQDDWLKKGIVRQEVVRGWYQKGEDNLQKQRERPRHWPQKPSPKSVRPPEIKKRVATPGIHVLPDVMAKAPARAFRLADHLCLLLRDVGPYVDFEHMTEVPNVRFPLVLVLCSPEEQGNFYLIALEQPLGGKPEMVEFPRVGEKRSLGGIAELFDDEWFVLQAMRITAARFNMEPHWEEVSQ